MSSKCEVIRVTAIRTCCRDDNSLVSRNFLFRILDYQYVKEVFILPAINCLLRLSVYQHRRSEESDPVTCKFLLFERYIRDKKRAGSTSATDSLGVTV